MGGNYNSMANRYSKNNISVEEIALLNDELFDSKTRVVVISEIFKFIKQHLKVLTHLLKRYDEFLLDEESSKTLSRSVNVLFRCCFALYQSQYNAGSSSMKTCLSFLDTYLFSDLPEMSRKNYAALSERCINLVGNRFSRLIKSCSLLSKSHDSTSNFHLQFGRLLYSVSPFMKLFRLSEGTLVYTAKEVIFSIPNVDIKDNGRWQSLLNAMDDYESRLEKFCSLLQNFFDKVLFEFFIFNST